MSDDINVNMIADQLAKKVDLPDNKGQDGIDYVVEWKAPTASDPTWYRVYKSGWIEQGGVIQQNQTLVTLPKAMINDMYHVLISYFKTSNTNTIAVSLVSSNTQTINSFTTGQASLTRFYQVSGQGANQ